MIHLFYSECTLYYREKVAHNGIYIYSKLILYQLTFNRKNEFIPDDYLVEMLSHRARENFTNLILIKRANTLH